MFTPPKGPATGAALQPRNSGDFAGRTLQTLHAARSLRKVTPKKPASPSLEAGPTLEEQCRDVRAHIKTRTLGVLDELLGMPNADFFAKPVDWRALGLHDYPEVVVILETCEKNRKHSVGIMLSRFSKDTWSPPDRPTRRVGSDSTVRQPGPPPTDSLLSFNAGDSAAHGPRDHPLQRGARAPHCGRRDPGGRPPRLCQRGVRLLDRIPPLSPD